MDWKQTNDALDIYSKYLNYSIKYHKRNTRLLNG